MAGRRKQQRQGCLLGLFLLLVVVGVIALAVLAFTGSSPLDGIARLVLGLALIAFSRAVAESGVHVLLGAADDVLGGQPPSEGLEKQSPQRPSQPHWYSPGRLLVMALGLTLVVSGLMLLTGDTDFIEDAVDSLIGND